MQCNLVLSLIMTKLTLCYVFKFAVCCKTKLEPFFPELPAPLYYPLGVFELESISPADLWLAIDPEPKPVNSFDRAQSLLAQPLAHDWMRGTWYSFTGL